MHSSSDSCVWAFGDVFLEGVRLCFCRGDFLFGSCTWLTPGPRAAWEWWCHAEPRARRVHVSVCSAVASSTRIDWLAGGQGHR